MDKKAINYCPNPLATRSGKGCDDEGGGPYFIPPLKIEDRFLLAGISACKLQ